MLRFLEKGTKYRKKGVTNSHKRKQELNQKLSEAQATFQVALEDKKRNQRRNLITCCVTRKYDSLKTFF